MIKAERDTIISKYQSMNMLGIFIIGTITSFVVVLYFDSLRSSYYSDLVKIINLEFKSLSVMITVFLPVVLIDAIYYLSTKHEIVRLNSRIKKIEVMLSLFALYTLVMFGNIRSWLMELYKPEYVITPDLLRRLDWIETTFLGLFGLAFAIFVILFFYQKINKITISEKKKKR